MIRFVLFVSPYGIRRLCRLRSLDSFVRSFVFRDTQRELHIVASSFTIAERWSRRYGRGSNVQVSESRLDAVPLRAASADKIFFTLCDRTDPKVLADLRRILRVEGQLILILAGVDETSDVNVARRDMERGDAFAVVEAFETDTPPIASILVAMRTEDQSFVV